MSLLSAIAPIVITLRGSKHMFRSAERTLRAVDRQQRHPAPNSPPKGLGKTIQVTRRDGTPWPVYDLAPRGIDASRRVVYLHGGCYVFEIAAQHWTACEAIARQAGAVVTVPIMPLAPLGVASAVVPAIADLVASLIDEVGAARVSVVGDSSGGGMALAVAMELRDRGLPPLGATVLIAPWLDIRGTDPRLAEIDPTDPWLAVAGTHAAGELYRAELREDDFRVSPIHGSLAGLGPVTMFSGTRDILNADAHRFVTVAAAAGLSLDFHEGDGMIHNYPILPMPEGFAARDEIVTAIRAD